MQWEPAEAYRRGAALARFAEYAGRAGASYAELHAWSISDLETFWSRATEFLGVRWRTPPHAALGAACMPGAEWFPGGELNVAEHLFANRDPRAVAIRFASEAGRSGRWTWAEFEAETARIRSGLLAAGVRPGMRVASYLPNIPEAVAAFAATASLGAVWTAAAPEFGEQAVLARFGQTRPHVLLGVDGYQYRGKTIDREAIGRKVSAELGARYVRFGLVDGSGWETPFLAERPEPMTYTPVRADHPLWVLYSSGTTGLPKAIEHAHAGVLVELLKNGVLQFGFGSADCVFWYTTTGWVMWNVLLAPLLVGSCIVLYDGHPDPERLWDLAAEERVTFFGTSAAWLDAVRSSGRRPSTGRDLSALQALGSTGSPLPPECYDWVYDNFPAATWLVSISGGTDVVTPLLGVAPRVPVRRGELGPPALGVDLQAWTDDGQPAGQQVGEMVVAQPIPSMPVAFWGDDGTALRSSYYDRFPGVWAHGDWLQLTRHGTGIIHGRSDATINRGGVRIGTAEIYDGLRDVPGLIDALAVDVPTAGTHGELVLFVVLGTGASEAAVRRDAVTALRHHCSPRHVPDKIVVVPDIPRTATGKKIEVPVKRILMGADPATAVSRASLANPEALDAVIEALRTTDAQADRQPDGPAIPLLKEQT
jgi:acetoacetyl-CoA synthetase